MPRLTPVSICPVFAVLIACGSGEHAQTSSSGPVGSTSTTFATSANSAADTTSTSSTSGNHTSEASSVGSTGTAGFVAMPDLPSLVACDPWDDTCPRGQKCKPYHDGKWKAVCADIDENPAGIGEVCHKNEITTFDDCPDGAMCFAFRTSDENLRCTPLCEGTPDEASCADVCSACLKFESQLFGVCPVRCDPLAEDCPEDLICAIYVFEPRFFCTSSIQGLLDAGEPCMTPFQCKSGTACLPADMLPSCAGENCCTPVCDLTQSDSCDAAYPGTVCAPWPTVNPDFHAECLSPGLGLCMAGL